uniref:DUF268 domain-containing protein n=1 Tax=Desertifilum tharense IPPAS B-1220 TaxID=1781255 RepID=A0ACD5GSW4_9CYAN
MVAPRQIPPSLADEYTMNGQIRQEFWYFNDDYKQTTPKVYTLAQIESLIQAVAQRQSKYYGKMDLHLYEALEKYPIRDRTIAIMGSQYPWYESICLHYGGQPTVIDYHKIQSQHPGIQTLTIEEYDRHPLQFDAAFSISSFEHDGLGRYGDPLNPNADLQAMQKMKRILKHQGLLFCSVPVGQDKLVWNAHRIYGQNRLPYFLQGWEILDIFGLSLDIYQEDTGKQAKYQPIFVLRNTEKNISLEETKNHLNRQLLRTVSEPRTDVKLHLGCGTKRLPGFVHVDVRPDVKPDVVADITNLTDFTDNSADLIYFCHGFEHVRPHQVDSTLAEWKRVLKPGASCVYPCPILRFWRVFTFSIKFLLKILLILFTEDRIIQRILIIFLGIFPRFLRNYWKPDLSKFDVMMQRQLIPLIIKIIQPINSTDSP